MSSDQGEARPHLWRATPVLRSADYLRSRDFYRDTLGFSVLEEGGNPPRFGIFERGRAVLFVDAWHGGPEAGGRASSAPLASVDTGDHAERSLQAQGWDAYFHVQGLEELAAELGRRGVVDQGAIRRTNYGMRELELCDPDGNLLCFGEEAEAAVAAEGT